MRSKPSSSFFLSRYRQQRQLAQQDLFSQGTVSDYLFAKDQIFAQANLDTDELALYRQLFDLLDCALAKARFGSVSSSSWRCTYGTVAQARP